MVTKGVKGVETHLMFGTVGQNEDQAELLNMELFITLTKVMIQGTYSFMKDLLPTPYCVQGCGRGSGQPGQSLSGGIVTNEITTFRWKLKRKWRKQH